MSNFRSIIKKHNATFYDFDTGDQQPVWGRYIIVSISAVGLVLLFKTISTETLAALLTVQSILIGFSFSVMFFLLSGNLPTGTGNGSIEADLKKDKLTKLSKELFYNVSYFNLAAIISVLLALLMMLPSIDVDTFLQWAKQQVFLQFWSEKEWKSYLKNTGSVLTPVLEFLLFASLIESLTTFIRTVGRVSFYFERRLQFDEN